MVDQAIIADGDPSTGTVMCSFARPLPAKSIAHRSNAFRAHRWNAAGA